MDELINFNEMEKDAIKEVGNVGTGNAATALSKLINKHIEIIIPETKFIPIKKFADEFGGPEKVVIGTYLEITGGLSGEALFIFDVDSAEKMADLLSGNDIGKSKIEEEMAESAFKEMTNIFTGAYITALADLVNIKIFPGVPSLKKDMLQSIIDFMLVKVSNYADTILSIKTKIEIKDVEIEGHFVIIFDVASINTLLSLLKKMY